MSFKSLLTNYKELVITPTPQNSFNNSYLSFSYYIKPTTAHVPSSAICKAKMVRNVTKSITIHQKRVK